MKTKKCSECGELKASKEMVKCEKCRNEFVMCRKCANECKKYAVVILCESCEVNQEFNEIMGL